jgi:arabinofuranosyltransferase
MPALQTEDAPPIATLTPTGRDLQPSQVKASTRAPSPDAGSRMSERARSLITLTAGVVVIVVFAVLAFEYRWISDDGLIVVREVRQILSGAGPNYNPLQRDEVDTSPLWTWLLAAVAFVCRGDIAVDAVVLGLVLAVAGLALALIGSRNFHRQRGTSAVLLPVGALVPLAIAPFWHFATSGLENGLSIFWFGLMWWLLVAATENSSHARQFTTAVVVGAGPLVRPDFALASAAFGIALLLIAVPGWRRRLGCVGVGIALPLAYQIFRMGYYGIAVPMPGLAKEAGSSLWTRGRGYLDDFVDTYLLWIPALLIVAITVPLLSRTVIDRRHGILIATPMLSGVLLGLYVVKVGGDYMHARMWIPVTLALLLPVLMLPVGRGHRTESVGAALLAVWALFTGPCLRPPYHGQEFGPGGVVDERGYEAIAFAGKDLTTTDSRTIDWLNSLLGGHDRILLMSGHDRSWTIPISPLVRDRIGFFSGNMGIAAADTPLDGTVIDINGLASPVSGHLVMQERIRPGHEKWLPDAWVLGEYADPAAISAMRDTEEVTKAQAFAARHALSCGDLKALLDSVDEPMSIGRFWRNLTGSLSRTSLRIPADPFVAERQFCHQ